MTLSGLADTLPLSVITLSFDVGILCIGRIRGYRIAEIPIRWQAIPGYRIRLFREGPRMILQWLAGPRAQRGAWLLWLMFAVGVTVMVAGQPDLRTVTHTYRQASTDWWAGRDLYEEVFHGFVYLPSSAILYTPFTWPPNRLAEVMWRWVILGVFASGTWRLARLASPSGGPNLFALVTLLSIPAALGTARTGQMDIPLVGLMIHGAVDLAGRRWGRATFSLCLAFALKPLAVVMALLAAALYRPMRWRLAAGMAAALLFPFLCGDPAYAWSQYQLAIHKLDVASRPHQGFCDLGALLRTMGIRVGDGVLMLVRAVAALATLALVRIGLRRWGEPRGAILALSFAAAYLMLFNPRTETNSYAILAPVVAVFSAWFLLADRRPREGWMLAAIGVGLGSNNYGNAIHAWTDHWFKAALGFLFLGYLAWLVLADRPPATPGRGTTGPHGVSGGAAPRGRLPA